MFQGDLNISVSAPPPFLYSPVFHLLGDGCWFGEQRSLEFYLDFPNLILHSATRWDNYPSLS